VEVTEWVCGAALGVEMAAAAPAALAAATMAAIASLTLRAVVVALMFLGLFLFLVAINVGRAAFASISASEGMSIAGSGTLRLGPAWVGATAEGDRVQAVTGAGPLAIASARASYRPVFLT
jgi:hypothetical protein